MNCKIMIPLVTVFCLAAGVTLAAQEGDASSNVKQLEQEMSQAQLNNDSTWFQQHLADGYVQGHSWGDWATREDVIKQMQDKSVRFKKGEISDVKVATFDPNVAIAHYKFTYDATLDGTHRARTVICSDTWINQSGAWKLAADHCSHVEGR